MAGDRIQRRERQRKLRHLRRNMHQVRNVALEVAIFYFAAEIRLHHRKPMRTLRDTGDLEAAFAIGERASLDLIVNAHQRPRQRLTGGCVAHDAVDGDGRACRGG